MKRAVYLLLILLLIFSINNAIAQIPRVISYQGMLLGSNEQPVAEGQYKLTFKIYDESNTVIWTEVHNQVFIGGGMFNVFLGSVTPLSIAFDKPYSLGIQVGSDPELVPRMPITSSAYAIRAEDADKLMGIYASLTPEPNKLLPLDASGKFPPNVISGGGTGEFIKKNVPDTSIATSTSPLIVISNFGDGDGINGRSVNGVGIRGRSENSNGVESWTGASDKSGVFGWSTDGKGVTGRSDNNDGIVGWTGAANKSGVFGHTATSAGFGVSGIAEAAGAVGMYAYHAVSGNSAKLGTDTHGLQVNGLSRFVLPSGEVNISTPGGNPGLITFAHTGHRRDIIFSNLGIRLLTSSSSSAADKGIDIDEQGNVSVTGRVTCASLKLTGGSDIAEPFDIKKPDVVKAGMVMVIDPDNPGKLKIADKAYDSCVAGVISGAGDIMPGMIMSQSRSIADGEFPIALTGRVYCLADASNGPIKPGDLLTTSDAPGYAMKVTDYDRAQGAILGKAMSTLEQGQGLVMILVTLQ